MYVYAICVLFYMHNMIFVMIDYAMYPYII